MTPITWAGPRCVQEPATILAPQNRTQGRCVLYFDQFAMMTLKIMFHSDFLAKIQCRKLTCGHLY